MDISIVEIVISIIISVAIMFIDWNWEHILVEPLFLWQRATILVTNPTGIPIPNATVIVSGSGIRNSSEKGEAKFYIPRHDVYGIQVKYEGFQAGHYMLESEPTPSTVPARTEAITEPEWQWYFDELPEKDIVTVCKEHIAKLDTIVEECESRFTS